MNDYVSFILAGFALVATPGPAILLLAATSANHGPRAGLRVMGGLLSSMSCIIVLTASGITALLFAVPGVATVAAVLAGAYMVYLAWRIGTAPVGNSSADSKHVPSFMSGFTINFVNPKAYAAIAALFSGWVLVPESPLVDALTKAAIALATMLTSDLAWIAAGGLLARVMRNPTAHRCMNLVFALLLLSSVALALLF